MHCEKYGRNTSKDMKKLFFCMATLGRMSQKSSGMFHCTRHILLILLLLITGSFRRMHQDLACHRLTLFTEIEDWILTWIP